ncbi:LysR family transcriptional regulator [Siccirubricoccus phaeus]|uniref:LysR family transcriptional regulator n=1 Tax=Siccirubricoccus phaeus TaxID=2595053 RepID=UPI0011F2CC9A|nr:LysR family transcriptional regulator [Siccirubricoccus phaeus]
MDFRQLTTFLHVAELGSVSKAAQRLRIAQPALSRQLRLLEQELKVSLFTRHGRGMVLTQPGHLLLGRAREILQRMEETRAELALSAAEEGGQLVFGLMPSLGGLLAARLVENFLERYPAMGLRIVSASSGYLQEWLHAGQVDLAVVQATAAVENLRHTPLLDEDLFLLTPGSGKASPLKLAEALRQRLVLTGRQHGLRLLIDRAARLHGVTLDVAVEADSLEVLKALVLRGVGATILPLGAVQGEIAAGKLMAAPIVTPGLSRRLVLAQPLAGPGSGAVQHFTQLLRAEVAAMLRDGLWVGQLPPDAPE